MMSLSPLLWPVLRGRDTVLNFAYVRKRQSLFHAIKMGHWGTANRQS
jgi:hypothetical protein